MKIKILLITLLALYQLFVFAQEEHSDKFVLSVASGLAQYTTTDHLINDYNYSGSAKISIYTAARYLRNKNYISINIRYNSAKLQPENIPNNYYTYNYIKQRETIIDFEYAREILTLGSYLQIFIGLGNSSYSSVQQEYYKNLLYSAAEGSRKSYDLSGLNLSPMILFNFSLKQHNVLIKTGYSLLHYASRPSDNYVKQIGLSNYYQWNFYSPKDFKNVQLTVLYQYKITDSWGINAICNLNYRKYYNDYKSLQNSYMLGFFKTFKNE
jgi:hypothetical protein